MITRIRARLVSAVCASERSDLALTADTSHAVELAATTAS